jgi:hypothetical protein
MKNSENHNERLHLFQQYLNIQQQEMMNKNKMRDVNKD